ncbi:Hypothetical protein D9617_86g041460 [Elsinoe fawcettii]|nr:Hypothetical protein D9617_86g041460 [Elsinoe fawcettii]
MGSVPGELGSIWKHLDYVRGEVQARLDVIRPEKQDVDVFTQHLQTVDQKAGEINGLKAQLKIMTQHLRRLEKQQQATGAPPRLNLYHQQPPPPQYPAIQPHGTPSSGYRAPPPAPGPALERSRPPQSQHPSEHRRDEYMSNGEARTRAAPGHATGQQSIVPHEAMYAPRQQPTHPSGWAAVNASHGKRSASIAAIAPHDYSAPGSPKRQKLATLMSRSNIGEATAYPRPGASQDSGKKSRTKSKRNANGILIRKDGQSDMRSLSSAQNLRKVHAKKGKERDGRMVELTSTTSLSQNCTRDDDKISVLDGSQTGSPVTPTTETQEKRDGIVQAGCSAVNSYPRESRGESRGEESEGAGGYRGSISRSRA